MEKKESSGGHHIYNCHLGAVYICVYVCVCACMCMCVCVCMYVCTCVFSHSVMPDYGRMDSSLSGLSMEFF